MLPQICPTPVAAYATPALHATYADPAIQTYQHASQFVADNAL